MRRAYLNMAVGTICALAIAATAGAGITAYDNYGPGHDGFDYTWGSGWTVAGDNLSFSAQYGVEQAFLFEPGASGTLSDIWVPMWYATIDSGLDEVSFRIVTNTDGASPKTEDILEEWVISDMENWSSWSEPHHLVGNGSTYLQQGVSYWLWAVPNNETTWAGWGMNPIPSLTFPHTLRREGEDWLNVSYSTAPALRVDVVPEPAAFGLLTLGLLALLRRR